MRLSAFQYGVWLLGFVLEGAVLWALVRRRLARRLPALFAYVAFQLCQTVLAFIFWHAWGAYDRFYWSGKAIGFVLAYFLILEIWKQGLRPYRGIWLLSRWVVGFVSLGLLAVTSATTKYGQGAAPQAAHWVNDWMWLWGRSVLFSQAVFLLAFFVVLGFFRVFVTSLVRRLALCWLGYSVAAVALYTLRYFLGPEMQTTYPWAFSLPFVVLLAAWATVVWVSPAEVEVEVAPIFALLGSQRQVVVEQMQLLNSSLLRMLKE